jgi:uncharacterized SAM-binding protein YcdF (DUF218 family)
MIRRIRKSVVQLMALGFLVVVLAGVLPVAPLLSRALLVHEPPRRADAIVVLGGGVHDDELPTAGTTSRLVHGLRLFQRGYAPIVILTGGNPERPHIPEAGVMERVARELGFNPDVLIVEKAADRTATQGDAVATIARQRGITRVLLVTSGEHSWRAARVFHKAGLEVISTPVTPRRPPRLTLAWHPLAVMDRLRALAPLLYESAAIGLYWWRGWL